MPFMHALLVAAFVLAQGLLLPATPSPQHATFAATASADAVTPGGATTLWVDVVPHRSVHIYAAGATDFQPVALVVSAQPSVMPGKVTYPKPDVATAQGSIGDVPAYGTPFRIALPVTVARSARPGDRLTVSGVVTYQACDDRLCYPSSTAPVTWSIAVKELAAR